MNLWLLRYLAVDVLRGQRWMAPLLTFLAAIALMDAGGGPVLGAYGSSAAALLPISVWLSMIVNQSEDPIQTSITVVSAGGAGRVRIAKLLVAFLGALLLAAFALAWPQLTDRAATASAVGAGASAHVSTALAGVGFGALLSRPVVRRTAWAVVGAAAVTLADILIPDCPPGRQIMNLLGADHPHDLTGPLALILLESLAVTAICAVSADRLARLRT